MDKTEENAEEIKSEIQQEIDDIKSKQTGNLEIEVTDAEPEEKSKPEEVKSKPKPKKTLTQSQKDKIRGTFRTITVQKNDNISKIAKRAGVSRATLEKLNPKVKKNPDLIYPGQKIRIGGK